MARREAEFKVVMVGESGVGKTSLVDQLYSRNFNPEIGATIGAAYTKYSIDLESGETVPMSIWDTAGQEKFQSLTPLYLRNAAGLIFVFDAAGENQLAGLAHYYESVKEQIKDDTYAVLCANKMDLAPDANLAEFQGWAKQHDMEMICASAKTGDGVRKVFMKVAEGVQKAAHDRKYRAANVLKDIVDVDGKDEQQEQNAGCC